MPKWVLSTVWESGFEEGRCRCTGQGRGDGTADYDKEPLRR